LDQEETMSRLQCVLFRIGAWGYLVTAGMHLAAHLSGTPAPANETERTLYGLMATYSFDVMGVKMTMHRLLDGFSVCYSLFMAVIGVSALAVLSGLPEGARVARRVAVVYALCAFALVAIGVGRFPPPPNVLAALIGLAFAGSLAGKPPSS
jgi:hypothetical protein